MVSHTRNHGDSWLSPGNEYVVIVGYDQHATLMHMTKAEYLSLRIHEDVKGWLERLGPPAPGIDDVSREYPWRHRSFIPGTNGLHAFFFYDRRHAMLFHLRWT